MTSPQTNGKRSRWILVWLCLAILVIAAVLLLINNYGGSSEHPIYTLILDNNYSSTLSIYSQYPNGSEQYIGDVDPGKEIIIYFDTHSLYIDVIGKTSDGTTVFSERYSYYSEGGPLKELNDVYRVQIPAETDTSN